MHKMKRTLFVLLAVALLFESGLPVYATPNHCPTPPHTKFRGFDPSGRAMCEVSDNPTQTGMTLFGLLSKLSVLIAAVIPSIMALTVLVIVWGIFRYIASGDEEEKREEGKKFVVYGIIGLFIMVSIWGLVNLLRGTFQLSATPANVPALPAIPGAK